jgi:Spy/CpxP family protein refolding chaperone
MQEITTPDMNLKKTALMVTASTMLMFAQGPGRMGPREGGEFDPAQAVQRRVQMLTQRLTLTAAQQAAATKIFTDATTASQALRSNMDTIRQGLNDAVKSNNTSAIESFASQSGSVQGQLTAIHARAEAAFYALLTAEQKTTYNQRPERGPGGPRGGPMGEPMGQGFGGRR